MSRRTQRSTVIIGLILIIGAIAVGVTNQSSSAHPKRTSKHDIALQNAKFRRAFGVLGRARAAATAPPLPAGVAEGLAARNPRYPGLDPSAAVYVEGSYPAWVVPGNADVCLVLGVTGPDSVPSSVCGSSASAEEGQIQMTTATASGVAIVVGLAPDTNSSVTVTDADGAARSVPVKDDVYEIVGGSPHDVSLLTASGTTTHGSVYVPPPPEK